VESIFSALSVENAAVVLRRLQYIQSSVNYWIISRN